MTWDELRKHKLVVYHTGWCPDCRRLEKRLDEHDVSYAEVDIDADPGAARILQERTGRQAIPYVEIDDKAMVRGWHSGLPGRWDERIFLKEVAEALG